MILHLSNPLGFYMDFPHSLVGKESACSAGDLGRSLGWERPPGEGNGNPLQYPCLENPMNREAWWAAAHGITELGMTEQLTLYLEFYSTK